MDYHGLEAVTKVKLGLHLPLDPVEYLFALPLVGGGEFVARFVEKFINAVSNVVAQRWVL